MSSQTLRHQTLRSWFTVLGILLLPVMSGCVRTVPSMPIQTEFHPAPLGTVVVQSVDTPPIVLYQKPPNGFVNGFFRGTARGAVVGSHVGKELAKMFIIATPEVTQECFRKIADVGCAYFMLATPMFGLFSLVGMPPLLTAGGSIYGGFSAYTASEVEEWDNTLTTVHKQVQTQTTFRDYVFRSLVSCCPGLLIGKAPSTVGSVEASNLQGVDTILRVEVLELGLAEASSNEMLEPDENIRPINPNPLVTALAPVGAIFQKSRSSLYVLVRTSLLILVRFQDETNCGRVLAWHDHAGLIRSS